MKFYLTLQVRFTKTRGNQVEVAEPHFHGRYHIVLNNQDIEHALRDSIMKIVNSFIEYQREESNWALDKVLGVSIHVVQYNPIKGSSYLPLPAKLAACLISQNLNKRMDYPSMFSATIRMKSTLSISPERDG